MTPQNKDLDILGEALAKATSLHKSTSMALYEASLIFKSLQVKEKAKATPPSQNEHEGFPDTVVSFKDRIDTHEYEKFMANLDKENS